MFEGNVRKGDGKVDQVQIQVIELQIGQGALAGPSNVLLAMVSVPEFAGDPQVLSATESTLKDL